MNLKTCTICKKDATIKHEAGLFCSQKCIDKYDKNIKFAQERGKSIKKCHSCGKVLPVFKSERLDDGGYIENIHIDHKKGFKMEKFCAIACFSG